MLIIEIQDCMAVGDCWNIGYASFWEVQSNPVGMYANFQNDLAAEKQLVDEISWDVQGPLLLIWININPSMDK